MGNANSSSSDAPPIHSSLLAAASAKRDRSRSLSISPSNPARNRNPHSSSPPHVPVSPTTAVSSSAMESKPVWYDGSAALGIYPSSLDSRPLAHRANGPALVPPSPFVGSPLLASDHFSYNGQALIQRSLPTKDSNPATPSHRTRHNRSGSSSSSAESESIVSASTAKVSNSAGVTGSVIEAALDDLDLNMSIPSVSLESAEPAVPVQNTSDASPPPVAKPTYVQPPNERSYKNSAKIVHASGISGLAPLAPLSRLGDRVERRKVIPIIVSWNSGGKTVYVTGTFNNWKQKVRLSKSTTDFTTVVDMPPGTHRFKFIVDDEWKCSEELPIASDPDGNLVNYLEVKDEYGDHQGDGLDGLSTLGDVAPSAPGDAGSSPSGSYTNEIPGYLLYPPPPKQQLSASPSHPRHHQRTPSSEKQQYILPSEPPPQLPAHLEKVLLNSNQVSVEDPSLLPVPNHVSLNHLYACSIRDGVLALATTTRYKKKYVTAVLYKPVFS
ncbi:5'-AMP-activated protein kinase beta subunit, interation domain-containing protein [Cladochytrium replicatum]|nr:5'-AMP-activated protein kinase beta subunit, interation domain-containing protein [Cladochytrium replicatum]